MVGEPIEYGMRVPKLFLLDIETAPMLAWLWGLYKNQHPGIHQIKRDWHVLTWAGKWLLEEEILSDVVTPQEALDGDDRRILQSIWDIVNEADIIIGHNAARFDMRKLNARWWSYGFPPPLPYRIIDTLREAQKLAATSSHKQEYLTKLLGLPEKIKTEFSLWTRCMDGKSTRRNGLVERRIAVKDEAGRLKGHNRESWHERTIAKDRRQNGIEGDSQLNQQAALDEMLKYNKQDVIGLQELYLSIRPWIKSHPNIGILGDILGEACPTCGFQSLTWIDEEESVYATQVSRFPVFRCDTCSAVGRSRFSALSKEQRKQLVVSVAG